MLLHLIILSSKEIIASILWHIWKARNHFTFCQQWTAPDPLVDVALAKETLYRHSLQQSAIPESPLLNPNRLWTPPDQGSYKANIDGAFTPNSNTGAIACVLRDHAGILIDGFSSTVRVSSPLQCEVQALIFTLTYLLEQGKQEAHLIVESDCLTLVETLNDRRASPWEIRAFVADVSVLRLSFPHLRIRHCRREANAAADWAAKAHARKSISPSWPKFPPAQLVTFLCIEMPYLWDVHFVLLE